MLRNIQSLSRVQRIVVFVLIFGGGLFALAVIVLTCALTTAYIHRQEIP